MKKILALILVCTMLMTMLASCDLVDKIKDLLGMNPPVCTEHVDADGDEKCDNCGANVPKPQPPVCEEHKDEDGDEKCDVCGADVPKPQPPVCTEHKDEDGDYKCDNCEFVMFEEVKYTLNISDVEAGSRADDEINGRFTIVKGTEVRNRTKTYDGVEYNKSVKLGSSSSTIKVSVPGNGTLRFIVQNGSSGAAVQYVKITSPDGKASEIEIPGTDSGSPTYMVELEVTEGDWLIQRVSGTVDVFYLELECVVAVAPESGFELVSAGTVSYLTGDALDLSKLQLNAIYENGKTDALDLSLVTIDTSKVDMSKEGVYDITVSYKEYAPITYQVSVYAPSEIKLGFDAIEKLASNSSAGNGVYFNHSFKELYLVGEELDTAGLTVIVVAKCGEKSLEFKVDDYVISGFDPSVAGEITLEISSNGVSATTVVHVTGNTPKIDEEAGCIKALVDPAYLGPRGDLSGPFYVFSTIQQALDFLAHADAATPKELSIAPGYYNEKLEITIPNLKIMGVGEKPEDVIIEWDSLYGQLDKGGFTHTTDSTATVAIRESAVNCVIENLTISNYWNTQERLDEAGLAIERNLALLVQADRFIMRNGALLAIQDTLELFTGRQYFENVFISGYTDFIFGTNNTTYFKNCTIHTIDTSKDDSGTAGYLTAFKGSNKGEGDAIVYGAIFDGCKFTADEGVTAGKTAIGRTWGAYAAVAVINSEIGEHISLDGYDKAENKNKRYISMNGIHPTDETVQFVEYNNTGAGAISEAVAGMRMLTAEEAALYADFATIFGTTNGKVTYLDPWDPHSDDVVVDDRDYYYFTTETSTTGTNHSFDTTTTIAKGSTLEWDGLLISAENGSVAWNANSGHLNMKSGAFIKFTVPAGTTVIVKAYSATYNFFTLNGVGTSTDTLAQYYAEETEVTLLSTGDLYLAYIIIDPNSEAPEAPTLDEIKVSGMNLNYTVGEDVSLEGVVLKALYSDFSVLAPTDFSVDTSAVNKNEAGAYDVVFTYGGKSVTVTVTYEDPNAGPEITKNTILDFSNADGYEAVKNNPRVELDGNFRANGSEYQVSGTIKFQVKAGTVVTVIPYANSQYASYTLGKIDETGLQTYNTTMSVLFTEDCTVVYTGLSNNYLVSIIIECPAEEGTYVFGGKQMEGDYTGILESVGNISISGTCKNHSGGAQLGADSQIVFVVPSNTSVVIQGYDTSYGLLNVYVSGELVEMNDKAQYVFNSGIEAAVVVIEAKNAGTDDAPAWNKSYITYIQIDTPEYFEESVKINFGSAGNYKEVAELDISNIQIGDNGGNNSQVKNGYLTFAVKKGTTVTVNGYPGYTSYTFSDGDYTTEEITSELYTYTAEYDVIITITPVSGNNYFYSIDIKLPVVVVKENVSIKFGSEGNYTSVPTLDMSGMATRDNGGNNSQLSSGSMKLTVLAGATVSIHGYPGYTSYTLNDGTTTTEEITATEYTYTATADVELIITAVSSNNYLYGIDVTY